MAVPGVCSGVPEQNSGKVPGILLENFSRIVNLVGACHATDDRIFATGSDSVSETVFAIVWLSLLYLSAYNHGLKNSRSPKHSATIAFCDPIFHPLSLLLGRDPCGDRILRSCLQKGPATTPANYDREMLHILGFRAPGKALRGTLGRNCLDLVPPSVRGVFFEIDSSSLLEFF